MYLEATWSMLMLVDGRSSNEFTNPVARLVCPRTMHHILFTEMCCSTKYETPKHSGFISCIEHGLQ